MRAEHHTFPPIHETTPTDVPPKNPTFVHAVLEMVKLINWQMGQQSNPTPPSSDVGVSFAKEDVTKIIINK
jgi:hypothetical protein